MCGGESHLGHVISRTNACERAPRFEVYFANSVRLGSPPIFWSPAGPVQTIPIRLRARPEYTCHGCSGTVTETPANWLWAIEFWAVVWVCMSAQVAWLYDLRVLHQLLSEYDWVRRVRRCQYQRASRDAVRVDRGGGRSRHCKPVASRRIITAGRSARR